MSSLAFLVTELQSLASETRRKHPEVREAAERSLNILRSAPEQATASLASDGPQGEDLLRPVFMGCATKNAKVVGISLGSLQRLISLKAVPQSAVPLIVTTMTDCVSQGVDIQLRILQTLLSLITNFPEVHGALLGDALLLCFRLHDSRIMVVSSTAAATLRQLVMFVVDKVVEEDKRLDILSAVDLQETALPDHSTRTLGPSARDAFAVFEDLCLLANAEKPNFLRLESLPKTFALELIESVVTNYHELFRKHQELLLLLQHHLSPLLHRALSDRPNFPLCLRSTRVVFLLLKQFSAELDTESEVFFMLLIRIIGNEAELGPQANENQTTRPLWMRVLAMEIMRGLCSDAELMRRVWERYDAEENGSSVFTSLVSALKRLISEKPALLGVGTQMQGVGVLSGALGEMGSGYGLDVGGVAGMVATAATSTVSGVVGMIASGPGLSVQKSAMKLQCIDQLDKADSPTIPEPYIYLLGVQCLVSLCEGFAAFAAPLYTSIMVQKPRSAGDAVVRAPPALIVDSLPEDGPHTRALRTVRDMVQSAWPALLAALSFVLGTNLSDELFVDALAAFQALANVAGMLGLATPRDAFFTSLARFAIPTRVVSSVDVYMEPATPRTAASMAENLGLSAPSQPPGLSERNMACLKVLISSAVFLAGSLDESWFDVLEALQNADYVLTLKGTRPLSARSGPEAAAGITRAASSTNVAQVASTPQPARHPLLTDLDPDHLELAIQRLFDTSKNMEDDAFTQFIAALCKLSLEMVGMQSQSPLVLSPSTDDLSPIPARQRRRVSGIHMPRTPRSGDFAINKLGGVAMLNIHRLIYRSSEVAWDPAISHLLAVICNGIAPQSIRIQAARVLDEILLVVPRNLSNTGDLKADVQLRVLEALSRQIILNPSLEMEGTNSGVELRRMGLETLHQILQGSGHTLLVGWEKIFEMLASVCKPAQPIRKSSMDVFSTPSRSSSMPSTPRRQPPPLLPSLGNERGYSALVKIAFQSLTLVCEAVSELAPDHLRLCISTIGAFGRQADTNIALTAAESLLWGVSDAIQAKRREAATEAEYSALWMDLLLEVLGLCTDARPEVRVGAIQTLFRSLQLYGATLSAETWDACLWRVTFPLLDAIAAAIQEKVQSPKIQEQNAPPPEQAWVDSKILALGLIGTVFSDFLASKIIHLESFTRAWDVFVGHIQDSVLTESRAVSAPALQCLEKAITPSLTVKDDALVERVDYIWTQSWKACEAVGDAVLSDANAQSPSRASHSRLEDDGPMTQPFSQESLVALVEVIRKTREASKDCTHTEWSLERLTRLMAILKGALTYTNSLDYRLDVDSLTPLQKVIMDAVSAIDLSAEQVPALVLRDLSDYATLPFLAAFDVPGPGVAGPHKGTPKLLQGSRKRITYIALTKKAMPLIVELYLKYQSRLDIYEDGTLEAILTAYAIPIKMKYDCPAPSKLGKDLPLWKMATSSFLQVIKEAIAQVKRLSNDISDERLESVWRQIIDVYRGGVLADCSAAEPLPLEVQEEEENFDLALLASLEIDITPHLGDPRIPPSLVSHLSRVLQEGSKLCDFSINASDDTLGEDDKTRTSSSRRTSQTLFYVDDRDYGLGTTHPGVVVPRERFSYWCFDLLFLICSDTAKDQGTARRRVAALSISALLSRCRATLISYVADAALRGNLPFPRVREEELLYVLRKLLELKLWPGSLWAAFSSSPSEYALEQPGPDASLNPSQLIADAVQRSSKAHLFRLYPVLCDIAASPRKTPVAWMAQTTVKFTEGEQEGPAEEFDARTLARRCLAQMGKEMGMEA